MERAARQDRRRPNWAGLTASTFLAKAPAGASKRIAVNASELLAERFDLKVRNDTKPMPAFALVAAPGKKLHLKEADGNGDSGCKGQDSPAGEGGGRIMMSGPDGVVTTLSILPGNLIQYNCRNMTMAAFAAGLQRFRVRTSAKIRSRTKRHSKAPGISISSSPLI